MVLPDHQHFCPVSWDPVMAAGDLLEVTRDVAQTEHHSSDDLQQQSMHCFL